MTFFQQKQQNHQHRYFIDSETRDELCVCGKQKGKKLAKTGTNKFNARKTVHGEFTYDSGKEANYAATLDLLIKAGKIKGYDRQFQISVEPEGKPYFKTKVDFRVHNFDGSFELHEVKSYWTARLPDYRMKRKAIDLFWLPKHPDTTYHEIV